jgi:hypothetical protein
MLPANRHPPDSLQRTLMERQADMARWDVGSVRRDVTKHKGWGPQAWLITSTSYHTSLGEFARLACVPPYAFGAIRKEALMCAITDTN